MLMSSVALVVVVVGCTQQLLSPSPDVLTKQGQGFPATGEHCLVSAVAAGWALRTRRVSARVESIKAPVQGNATPPSPWHTTAHDWIGNSSHRSQECTARCGEHRFLPGLNPEPGA